jgi:hypothetical protein
MFQNLSVLELLPEPPPPEVQAARRATAETPAAPPRNARREKAELEMLFGMVGVLPEPASVLAPILLRIKELLC